MTKQEEYFALFMFGLVIGLYHWTNCMKNQDKVKHFYDEKRGSYPTLDEACEYFDEELSELAYEINEGQWAEPLAKELADVMFTLYGIAITEGIDLDKAFDLVCESNMTKKKTRTGKVVKGRRYKEPDMSEAVLDA